MNFDVGVLRAENDKRKLNKVANLKIFKQEKSSNIRILQY